MNLSNREQLIASLQEANQPNPEEQQAKQQAQQAQIAFQGSQTAALEGQAIESQARAQKLQAEAQAIPQELEIDRIKAVTSNLNVGTEDDKEFERRIKMSKEMLKEREIAVKEGNVAPPAAPMPQATPQPSPMSQATPNPQQQRPLQR